jgi:Trypsin
MQKLQLFMCCIFLSAFLASCGQSNVPPVVQTDSVPDTSTQITSQEHKDKDYDVPRPKKDWIEALNTFAKDNPAFAGYDFSADRKELIFYVAEKHKGQKIELGSEESRGRKLGHMRKEFLELIDRSTGFPEVTNDHGVTINPRLLKMRSVKSSLSLADLNEYRAALQEFLYSGKANKLSIDFAQNKINLQVNDEVSQQIVLNFLRVNFIPVELVNLTIDVEKSLKNVFDSFRPAVGGVAVYFGTSASGVVLINPCTIGLPILADAVEGYLIASHCSFKQGTSNDGSVLFQKGEIIGNKTFDSPLYACTNNGSPTSCQNADTTFYKSTIPLTRGRIVLPAGNTGSLLTTIAADGKSDAYYDVTSVAERVGNGETIYSIGSTSGIRSATVVNWNSDVVVSAAVSNQVLKNMVTVSNTSFGAGCQGDSGGPWFQITGTTTAKFAGILSTGNTLLLKRTRLDDSLAPCYSNVSFSPVAQIRTAFPGRVFTFTR